jgi:succinate-acetate transporter protein
MADPVKSVPVDEELSHSTGAAVNGKPQARANVHNEYYNPMAHVHTGNEPRLPAFGGEFQPGLYRSVESRKFANPAPLGLSAFALTTFVLSAVNLNTRGVTVPNIAVPLALGYGGLVQLLAGMW